MTILALKRSITVERKVRGGRQFLVLLDRSENWWSCLCVGQTISPSAGVHDYSGETISVHADDLRLGSVYTYQ